MLKTVFIEGKYLKKVLTFDHFQRIIMFLLPFYITLFYITIVNRLFVSEIYIIRTL